MVCRFHTLGTGQLAGQRLGVVDKHGKMLRTDPELLILEFKCNQGNLLSRTIARHAMRFIRMISAHCNLSSIICCIEASDPPICPDSFVRRGGERVEAESRGQAVKQILQLLLRLPLPNCRSFPTTTQPELQPARADGKDELHRVMDIYVGGGAGGCLGIRMRCCILM